MNKVIVLFFSICLFVASSCNDDPCKDIACGINQLCTEGVCSCTDGWLTDSNGNCTIEDLCFNVDCGTNGTCNQGTCECDTGYEQDADGKCNTEIRSKFVGTWMGTHESNGTVSASYTTTISNSTEIHALKISNLMNQSCPSGGRVEAIANLGDNSTQFFSACTGISVSSLGVGMNLIDATTLRIHLYIDDQNGQTIYTAIYTKQ